MTELLSCHQLVKIYRVATSEVHALQGLDLSLAAGEMLGVVGASGSGKSTLLGVVSGLVRPSGGQVLFDGLELGRATRSDLDNYRRHDVGFLWQQSSTNLVPYLSARDNIMLPLAAASRREASVRADRLLELVGLTNRRDHLPRELSGGEQQRVALAVALVHRPRLLLADEPTGELDGATTEQIFELMRRIGAETGLTQIIVSHDPEVTRHVDRVIALRDGRVASEQRMTTTDQGSVEVTEVTMLDSIGRLQLTDEQRAVVGTTGRVHAELVDGALQIRPAGIDHD